MMLIMGFLSPNGSDYQVQFRKLKSFFEAKIIQIEPVLMRYDLGPSKRFYIKVGTGDGALPITLLSK